jgi:hypothetical protein
MFELPPPAEDLPVIISIFDLRGQLVSKITAEDNFVPVNRLLPGMYLLRAEIPGLGTFNSKLMISR